MYQDPSKPDTLSFPDKTHLKPSQCNGCNICKRECAFLSKYGNPGEIEKNVHQDPEKWQSVAFECSLCGLCTALCPRQLDPSGMFLDLRRQAVAGGKDLSGYKTLLNYEKRGVSPKYTYHHLPEDCRTVFFPGCSLTGTRPGNMLKVYQYLQTLDDSTGILLDCCTKPSHDLGRQDYFEQMFSRIKSLLLKNNIEKVIVACPSCHKIFNTYATEFHLETIYEVMAAEGLDGQQPASSEITFHDPCPVRFQPQVHDAVRSLVKQRGFKLKAAKRQKNKTRCCGEGGAVNFVKPEWAGTWCSKISDENSGKLIATYCAGCAGFLAKKNRVFHLLDLVFDPERALRGKARVSRAPFTYLNRLKVKKILKKMPVKVQIERKFVLQSAVKLSGFPGKFFKKLGL